MPSEKQHIEKAKYNKNFLNEIFVNKPHARTYPDWGIVVVFYTAYHYVHAYFARKLDPQIAHPDDHVTSLNMVSRHIPFCWGDYNQLYNDSRIARYLKPIPPYTITKERLDEDIKILSNVFEKL